MVREYKGKSLTNFVDNYTVVDIETTGLSPIYDDIIEIGAIKVVNGEIVDLFCTLVNPGYKINPFVINLTGITNEMLATAPSFSNIVENFVEFVKDDVVVGHNVNFDINFLYDKVFNYTNLPLKNDFIDTMRFARKLCKSLEHHTLHDLVEFYSIESYGQHRSLADCKSTKDLYDCLKKTALVQFESIEAFSNSFKKKGGYKSHSTPLDLRNIEATTTDFDETHPLYNKVCVFTGTLEKMVRKEAAQLVVNCGGIAENNVTTKTNYLILGNNDYCKSIKDGKSSKQKKAEALIEKGSDLLIMPESVFYDLFE